MPLNLNQSTCTSGVCRTVGICVLECKWQQVNKLRAQSRDPATFDEMYEHSFITHFCSFM